MNRVGDASMTILRPEWRADVLDQIEKLDMDKWVNETHNSPITSQWQQITYSYSYSISQYSWVHWKLGLIELIDDSLCFSGKNKQFIKHTKKFSTELV